MFLCYLKYLLVNSIRMYVFVLPQIIQYPLVNSVRMYVFVLPQISFGKQCTYVCVCVTSNIFW